MLRSAVLPQKEGERAGGRTTTLVFEGNSNYVDDILSDAPLGHVYSSINFLGKQLVLYNIEKLIEARGKITHLFLPAGMSAMVDKIADVFPEIQIDEYVEPNNELRNEKDILKIPLNSIVVKAPDGECVLSQIVYPWDILKTMEYVLETEIKSQNISKDVSIESGSVVDGPCLIEAGVSIDSFCKIKGPVYIGENSKIGTGSLVRNSMVGNDCTIGFTCEVARSYVAGNDTFPHYDAVLDSVVGEHTWMGGYVAITNVMLNNKQVRYKINGNLLDTGLFHFGAVIGHHSTIGAGVVILPGRYMPPRSFVPPHILYSSVESLKPTSQ
jgi:UDP-N-acetylglucosamine diphosphorylase / glucose-1-phosphate thymidylyltransferase / UDP-N-acetylgalactosamine diphosphorylase / glucosamine-1-phosphate N-acetyltransferase / galactosamine-1-phosphate N-acetyltransferase